MRTRAKWLVVVPLGLGLLLWVALTMAVWSAEVQAKRPGQPVIGSPSGHTASVTKAVQRTEELDWDPLVPLDDEGTLLAASQDATGESLKYAALTGTAWVSETVDVCAGDASLALDGTGNPHVAYTHCAPEVNYSVLSDTTWLSETVDGAAIRPSLALDISGNPHLSYCDLVPLPIGQGVKYTHWTGSAWVKQGVDAVRCNQAPSLALDSSDIPHIAYCDEGSDSLKYGVLSGTVWISQTVDLCAGEPSLVLDSSDNPHIAYTQCGPQVSYAVLSGTTWLTQTVDGAAIRPSLALDSNDDPRISYCDLLPPPIGLGLKYTYWTGSGWDKSSADGIRCDSPSLALDGSDTPHIAYHDTGSNSVKYAVLSDTTWISVTVDAYALSPSLVLDAAGDPHIAYTHVEYRTYVPLAMKKR